MLFNKLPIDVIQIIFGTLSFYDMKSFRLTCKLCRDLTCNLVKTLYIHDYNRSKHISEFPKVDKIILNYKITKLYLCNIHLVKKLAYFIVQPKPKTSFGSRRALISDISPLALCPNLTYIDVSFSNIANIDLICKSCKKISYLNLGNTRVTDISGLRMLSNLKYLSLKNTKIKDIHPLYNSKTLQYLDIAFTNVKYLVPLFKIECLNIRHSLIDNVEILNYTMNNVVVYIKGSYICLHRLNRPALPNVKLLF